MIAVALMMLVPSVSKADKVIQVVSADQTAETVEIPLSKILTVSFGEGKMNVMTDDKLTTAFDLKAIDKILFGEASAIGDVEVAAPFVVATNPVRDNLVIKGGNEFYGNNLEIYSVQGKRVVSVHDWKGQDVNVSGLQSGVYFLNIKSVTIKIIKL